MEFFFFWQAKTSNSPPPSVRTRRATAAAALVEDERDAPKSTSKLAFPKYSKMEKQEKISTLTGRLSTLSKVIHFPFALMLIHCLQSKSDKLLCGRILPVFNNVFGDTMCTGSYAAARDGSEDSSSGIKRSYSH